MLSAKKADMMNRMQENGDSRDAPSDLTKSPEAFNDISTHEYGQRVNPASLPQFGNSFTSADKVVMKTFPQASAASNALFALAYYVVPVIVLGGCGGPNTPPPDMTTYVSVSGVVKVNGKPFRGNGYVVAIIPSGGAGASMSEIGADGSFTVQVPAGPATVAVVSPDSFTQAHGDGSLTSDEKFEVTIAEGQAVDVDLKKSPPPLPKSTAPGADSGHNM